MSRAIERYAPAVALAAGVVSVAAFGDWILYPLALAAFALLAWLLSAAATPKRAAAVGFAYGSGLFLAGVSWVYVSLHDFGMMPAPLAAAGTFLFCLYLALFPGAVGWLQARLSPSRRVRLMLLIPALWTLAEWLRAWLLTGFPWLTLGYAQIDSPLAGFLPLAGVYGLTLVTALIAGAMVLIATGPARISAVAIAVAFAAAGFGLQQVRWTQPRGAPLAVALLQGNIPQEMKFVPGRFDATLETYAKLAESSQAKLIIWPETAIPRLLEEVDPRFIDQLRRRARANGGDMIVGAPLRDARGAYYNAVISLGASPSQGYAKSHLVPFGEFIPPGFGWVLTWLRIPLSDFSRGAIDQPPLAVAGEEVAMNICYEDVFGEEIIRQLPKATLLANVSNVAWFGDSLAPAQHLRISRTRALESGRYLVRATNTGVTAVIDERGTVIARLASFTQGKLEAIVQGRSGATPYVRFGNHPALIAACVLLAAGIWAARRRAAASRANRELAG